MCSLMAALTVVVAQLSVDAYPTYEAWDMKEMTEEDMNKPLRCHFDVSNKHDTLMLLP
jgi:hypothetical protein